MDFHVKRGNRTDISAMTYKKDNTMKTNNGKDVSMKTDNGKDVTAMTDNRKYVTMMLDSRKDVTIMTNKKDVTMMTGNRTGISSDKTCSDICHEEADFRTVSLLLTYQELPGDMQARGFYTRSHNHR
ncbi:hypothetical protein ACOMHN_011764 [Nucella lapillus]